MRAVAEAFNSIAIIKEAKNIASFFICPRGFEINCHKMIKYNWSRFFYRRKNKEEIMEACRKTDEEKVDVKRKGCRKKIKTFFGKLSARITGIIIGWSSTITLIQCLDDPFFETLCWAGVALVFSEVSVRTFK